MPEESHDATRIVKKTPRFWMRFAQLMSADLPTREKLVLVAIFRYAGDNGGSCWVSQEQLAAECGGVDVRTIRRAISELSELGIINGTRRGKTMSNQLTINWQGLDKIGVVTGHQCPITMESDRTPMSKVTGHPCPGDRTPVSCLNNKSLNKSKEQKQKGDESDDSESKTWKPRFATGAFKNIERGLNEFEKALAAGAVKESDRLRWMTLWVHCGRRHAEGGIRNPGAVFRSCVEKRSWEGTQADEDAAQEYLKERERQSRPAMPEDLQSMLAGVLKTSTLPEGWQDDPNY